VKLLCRPRRRLQPGESIQIAVEMVLYQQNLRLLQRQ